MFVKEIADFVSPWNALYSGSTALSTGVTAVHILALLFGGGLALAADRTSLRMLKRPEGERLDHLRELEAVHRPVVIAMLVLFVSGVGMAAADVETFATSWYFWVKMGLVALLLANGWFLLLTERRLNLAAATAPPPAPPVPVAPEPGEDVDGYGPAIAVAIAPPAEAMPVELRPIASPALWRRLRVASIASLTLWALTALAGAVLTGAA